MKRTIAKVGAAFALLAAGNAQAAQTCITAQELHGLVGYLLPDVLGHVSQQCAPSLKADGYVHTGLPSLIDALDARKEAAWPDAKAAFLKFVPRENGKQDKVDAIAALPDDVLRPMVDEALLPKLDLAVTPGKCADIEDVLQALAPLSAEDSVHLVATVFALVSRKDTKIPSCPREPKVER